jgi:hypothetical protein
MKIFARLVVSCALLALLPACVYLDHPTPLENINYIGCREGCDPGYGPAATVLNLSMFTAGDTLLPSERGEYMGAIQAIEPIACDLFYPPIVRIDTYRNEAVATSVGCPPLYYCYSGALLDWSWLMCPPDRPIDNLCTAYNGQCAPPFWWGPSTTWPAGVWQNEIAYIAIDRQPGAPGGGSTNLKRAPGGPCPGCADDMADMVVDDSADVASLARVPDGNNAAAWSLGYMMYAPFELELQGSGLPYTEDYASYIAGVDSSEADLVADFLRYHPADENGEVRVGVSHVSWNGSEIDLNPPFTAYLKLHWTDRGLSTTGRTEFGQSATPDLLRFIRDNTDNGQPVNFSDMQITTDAGFVAGGQAVKNLVAPHGDLAIGHERLNVAIESHEGGARVSRR